MTGPTTRPPSTITVRVPLKLTVRGGRKTILGDFSRPATRTRFDDSIIKALVRAHRWRSLIEEGHYSSITELAKARGVNQSYACRILRLTNLAPDLIEAIVDRRGSNLTLSALLKPFPEDWREQRVHLHILKAPPHQG
jgi:hypothetical protein